MNNVILVIAAHPDDEVLGMAGTMMKHIKNNDDVHVLFMADGVTARDREYDYEKSKGRIVERKGLAKNACEYMGVKSHVFFDYSNLRMDMMSQLKITKDIEDVIAKIKPDVIYTHHTGDMNKDHRITFESVMTACRPLPDFCVKEIYTYEVLSSTEWAPNNWTAFQPDKWVDITDFFDDKIAAMQCYDIEMRAFPHPRSEKAIRALAELRGSQMGLYAAEAFCTIRHVS